MKTSPRELEKATATSRRALLNLGLLGAAGALTPFSRVVSRAYAAPGAAGVRFLLVFLRGGYDAANVVIPVGSPFYYEARPKLAVPAPDARNPQAALPLARPGEAAGWGLHPALKDSVYPLWRDGQLAFVPFAGIRDMSRSHFETQDSVEAGVPSRREAGMARAPGSGFLEPPRRSARRCRSPRRLHRWAARSDERRRGCSQRLAPR